MISMELALTVRVPFYVTICQTFGLDTSCNSRLLKTNAALLCCILQGSIDSDQTDAHEYKRHPCHIHVGDAALVHACASAFKFMFSCSNHTMLSQKENTAIIAHVQGLDMQLGGPCPRTCSRTSQSTPPTSLSGGKGLAPDLAFEYDCWSY